MTVYANNEKDIYDLIYNILVYTRTLDAYRYQDSPDMEIYLYSDGIEGRNRPVISGCAVNISSDEQIHKNERHGEEGQYRFESTNRRFFTLSFSGIGANVNRQRLRDILSFPRMRIKIYQNFGGAEIVQHFPLNLAPYKFFSNGRLEIRYDMNCSIRYSSEIIVPDNKIVTVTTDITPYTKFDVET